jgi:hypothetical protein
LQNKELNCLSFLSSSSRTNDGNKYTAEIAEIENGITIVDLNALLNMYLHHRTGAKKLLEKKRPYREVIKRYGEEGWEPGC